MRKLIVGLFVFALLFVLWMGTSPWAPEGFADARTPLTVENVLKLVNDTIIEYVDAYQKLKSVKSDDPRVKGRLQVMAQDINVLNEQYPAIEYTIQQYDFSKVPMLSLEDLKLVKDFFTTRVGLFTVNVLTTPADLAEVDVMSNRIQSIFGFIQQKIPLAQQKLPANANIIVRQTLENILKLKLRMGSLPASEIPLFKSDLYWTATNLAKDNFVFPPDLLNKPLIEVQTQNLPLPVSPLKLIQKEAQKQPQIETPPVSVCPPPPPPPPPCPECPKCPPPEGKRYSELIKDLLIEGDLLREFRNIPQ
jgi:hypothetical protein